MKSARFDSSSSPTGESSDNGSCEIRNSSRTRSGSSCSFTASSSTVGSRSSSWCIWRRIRVSRFMCSTMWTGMRIVRAWSAIERVIAWRIHHVAYVENLKPLVWSNLSTARIRPRLPSWIRSRSCIPRPE